MMSVASYTDFSSFIHQHHAAERVPLEVALEVTRRCPLECLHCYNNLAMGDLAARNRELSKEEYFKVLDELEQMGCFWLLFTGGEIFARRDFLEIYTYAKTKGFLITLFTNGTLISEKIVNYLLEWPPFAVEITLYGRTRETYEALTAIPGSYDRCLRGIKLLRDSGLPLKLKTVGTSVNKHEVLAMKQFAEEELHVEFKFEREMQSPTPQGGGATVYSCGGGVKSFAIDPYGHMTICVLSHQESYDIRTGSVKQGWDHFLLKVRQRERRQITKCAECRLHSVCSMCPANGELENGDPESPVDFLCEVAHLRAMALGFEVPEHGSCDYCRDGVHYSATRQSARRIAAKEIDVGGWQSPQVLLPILNDRASSAGVGCGGCGGH